MRRPLLSLLQLSRLAIRQSLAWCFAHPPANGAITLIDGTCGNGHDTLFMATAAREHLNENKHLSVSLLAFDVQQSAIEATKQRLEEETFPSNLQIALHHTGHEHVSTHCPPKSPPMLAVYNLGFLPGSDKTIITSAENSLTSFASLMPHMPNGAMFIIHAYGGHEGGMHEVTAVRHWAKTLPTPDWTARCYENITPAKKPESLFLIEKRS